MYVEEDVFKRRVERHQGVEAAAQLQLRLPCRIAESPYMVVTPTLTTDQ
jgi:hypothetical protein